MASTLAKTGSRWETVALALESEAWKNAERLSTTGYNLLTWLEFGSDSPCPAADPTVNTDLRSGTENKRYILTEATIRAEFRKHENSPIVQEGGARRPLLACHSYQ
jgi:hypothetical protein